MKLFERSVSACSLLLYRLACGALLPSLTLLIIADIASRALGHGTLHWASEVAGLMLLCLFFLILPQLAAQHALLRIDLVQSTHRLLTALPAVALLLFSMLLLAQSALGIRDMLLYGDQAFSLPLPLWPFSALMLLSATLLLLQSVLTLWRSVRASPQP